MRNLLIALVAVALLAAPSMAVVDVKVVAGSTAINVGGPPTTVTVQVRGNATPVVGVASIAGDVTATGTAGALSAANLVFANAYKRSGPDPLNGGQLYNFPSVAGAAGANGGWAGLGSGQITQVMNDTSATYGGGVYVNFASCTVTGVAAGTVTLTFTPGTVGGYLVAATDATTAVGTITPVTITVTGPTCPGDADGNLYVDVDDLSILADAWGSAPGDPNWDARADFDGNEYIDVDDLSVLADNWGVSCE